MTTATTRWISGPVLRAEPHGRFALREAVYVGADGLLGEVIQLRRDEIVVQVYEETTGLRPGTEVRGTGRPLAVPLGPGVLGKIFDGLLRPICRADEPYVRPGLHEEPPQSFPFEPDAETGAWLDGGAVFGRVVPPRGPAQRCLVPPQVSGRVVAVAAAGSYTEDVPVLTLEDASGQAQRVALRHPWPVREPRPIRRRLPADQPLLTGQRVLDSMFPVMLGGRAAIPGGFGTGKTVLLETLAKWCSADVIVYVGCGERGNEMSGLLEEFSQLEDPKTGALLLERTVIIANTSNMPVAAREASIYTGVTVAEYFRDQGLDVAMIADSTSRWAEALREVSGRLGEIPGEGGYPAYLSSRLAEFYERAARVETLAGEIGSVTVMGAVSPPSGDFSEPVTSHTRRYVRSLWVLDADRARARFYPAVHPLQSYSLEVEALQQWWQRNGCVRWGELRGRFLGLLEDQARLERMARIIGKDAMPERQRLTLVCAALVNESFLRQSAFAPNDRFAAPERQAAMMRLLGRFLDLAGEALAAGATPEAIAAQPVYRRLLRMGEEVPQDDPGGFRRLGEVMEQSMSALIENGESLAV